MKTIVNRLPLIALGTAAFVGLQSCGREESGDKISVSGSDTLLNVGLAWAEEYKKAKPDVSVSINGGGSGVGIKALMDGKIQVAHSSRAIKASELERFAEKHGDVKPVEHIVGFDGIAVYTHKDNPVKEISIASLKGIFAEAGGTDNWDDVPGGMTGVIKTVGRTSASGTHDFFKKAVCGKGVEFRGGISEHTGSAAVVELVHNVKTAIGYSGMGYKTDGVNWLAVSKAEGEPAVMPSPESVLSKAYPISRPLYLYTLGEPEGAVKEYIDWIKGAAGQAIVESQKFVPLPVK